MAEYSCLSGKSCIILHMENENVVNESDTAKASKVDTVKAEKPSAPAEQAVVAEPEPVQAEEAVKPKDKAPVVAAPVAVAYAVVGTGDTDEVYLSKCIYKNQYARKSLTVHHLQRRLTELGYKEADSDKDGWYGDLTKHAVSELQADRGIEGSGVMNAETFAAIFDGDPNVTVIID